MKIILIVSKRVYRGREVNCYIPNYTKDLTALHAHKWIISKRRNYYKNNEQQMDKMFNIHLKINQECVWGCLVCFFDAEYFVIDPGLEPKTGTHD